MKKDKEPTVCSAAIAVSGYAAPLFSISAQILSHMLRPTLIPQLTTSPSEKPTSKETTYMT